MALEDLKDQIQEKWADLWGRIQDSPAYNSLMERYQTFPPHVQVSILVGVALTVFALIISIPASYFSTSMDNNSLYEEKRQLIRNLLRASQIAGQSPGNLSAISPDSLRSRVQNELTSLTLQSGQIENISALTTNELGPSMARIKIIPTGLSVRLKKLNLNQIVTIGNKLQIIHPGVKLAGLDVTADKPDPHYYNVDFRLAIYNAGGSNTNAAGNDNASDESAADEGDSEAEQ